MADQPLNEITDPDELRYEMHARRNNPTLQIAEMKDVMNEIEIHLRYGLPSLKWSARIIIVLLALILWRLW